jgi:hypothetical protein
MAKRKAYAKVNCEECGKITRKIYKRKGKLNCYECYMKKMTRMPETLIRKRGNILEEEIKKVRNVNAQLTKNALCPSCRVNLPSCYYGLKVLVIPVGKKDIIK